MARLADYQHRYANLALSRDPDGVLKVRFHTEDGPFVWSAQASADFAEAFHVIGSDPETKVVLLTGSGEHFCIESDDASFSDLFSADGWCVAAREGRQLIEGLTGIDVPVVSAINGPAHVHSELLLLGDLIVASERASFQDKGHFPAGVVPGDGIHALWTELIGPVRAKHFLLTGQVLSAQDALRLGVVSEVTPDDELAPRASGLAAELAKRPIHVLRYTKLALNQRFRRSIAAQAEFGLAIEGYGLIAAANGGK